ncbi:hypothetical protein M407DRAFT_31648 [Tulasnella calospora MUT 4182]|uniref:F-box domain-containing protein n=1 Tax=Tulasnella calospora MUT 4182 TaxID=1051891 RepID=A0A0C3Q599_9AGAM|nr:hypothetical protein M407DRAFT_31648 [Tulasnella calospora MUT 4182]
MDSNDPLALLNLYIHSTFSRNGPPENLDRKLSDLRKLRKELDIRIIQISRERNVTTSAIYRLPAELLIRILYLTLPSCEAPNGPVIQLIRSVSHRWKETVDGEPRLWRKIHGQDRIPHLKQTVDRSVGVSFDVYWDFRDAKEVSSEQFFQTIGGTFHRWRSATLRLSETAQRSTVRRTLETKEAPLLEELVLLHRDQPASLYWMFGPVNLFGGKPAPKLRNIWISQLPVVLNPAVFANLQDLHLHAIPFTPARLLLILQKSPELRSLSLDCLELAVTGIATTESTSTPVHLPKLERLHVYGTVFQYSRYILANVDAPNCDNFHIATHLGSTFPHYQFSLEGLSQFEEAIKRGAWEISITVKRTGDYRIACNGTSCVTLGVSSEHALSHSIEWLNNVIGSDTPVPTSLLFEGYDFSHPSFQLLLPILRRIDVNDIVVGRDCLNTYSLIAALAVPDIGANDSICNRWPNIRKVRINPRDRSLLPHILDMVKSRINVRNVRVADGYFGHNNIQELYLGERLPNRAPADSVVIEPLNLIQGLLYPGMVYWHGSSVGKLRAWK